MVNLDALDEATLSTFISNYKSNKDPIVIKLVQYAKLRKEALFNLNNGYIAKFVSIENKCNDVFDTLPKDFKWK
jgi:hypothetical protein